MAPSRSTPQPTPPSLIEAQDRFIAAWGQMGSTWGISRTMAEVHALLYICGTPLCTDDVMDRLAISRGNASMSLRALVDWGIVEREHKRGDRKEYFRAEQDVWTLVRAILRERLKREIHPVMASLAEMRDEADGVQASGDELTEHTARLDALLSLLRTADQLTERFLDLPVEQLRDTAGALSEAMRHETGDTP